MDAAASLDAAVRLMQKDVDVRRKNRSNTTRTRSARPSRLREGMASLWSAVRRPILHVFAAAALMTATVVVLRLLDRRVEAQIIESTHPRLDLVEVPDTIRELVMEDLTARLKPLLSRPWTDPQLCEALGQAAAESKWVSGVSSVRRRADGTFLVTCRYVEPFAMIDTGNGFALLDRQGTRLPGRYMFHRRWKLIQGAREPSPEPGQRWTGADVAAALAILARIEHEPFAQQITGVMVGNMGGRVNALAPHIELATDRTGGRIQWGSAPGAELEENSVDRKIALLGATYRKTGRVDGGFAVIDIATFPDRIVARNP